MIIQLNRARKKACSNIATVVQNGTERMRGDMAPPKKMETSPIRNATTKFIRS